MERPSTPEAALSPRELLGVTRLLLSSARHYNEALDNDSVFGAAIDEGVKQFYELAAPQLAETVIDQKLFGSSEVFELDRALDAIDAELASWQRGGLVVSQVEPLERFTRWLYSLHTIESLELIDDEASRRTIERHITRAARVLE